MKKSRVVAVAAVLILGLASLGHAEYVTGFKIVEVAENQVTIQKGNDEPVMVEVKKDTYKVGDKVKYDEKKQRIKPAVRRQIEGC